MMRNPKCQNSYVRCNSENNFLVHFRIACLTGGITAVGQLVLSGSLPLMVAKAGKVAVTGELPITENFLGCIEMQSRSLLEIKPKTAKCPTLVLFTFGVGHLFI